MKIWGTAKQYKSELPYLCQRHADLHGSRIEVSIVNEYIYKETQMFTNKAASYQKRSFVVVAESLDNTRNYYCFNDDDQYNWREQDINMIP